jgi:hypothetical protein
VGSLASTGRSLRRRFGRLGAAVQHLEAIPRAWRVHAQQFSAEVIHAHDPPSLALGERHAGAEVRAPHRVLRVENDRAVVAARPQASGRAAGGEQVILAHQTKRLRFAQGFEN